MEPKDFQSLEDLEQWVEGNPDEVGRHILDGWRHVLKNGINELPLVQCDEVKVTAKLNQAEAGVEALMQSAIDREDYELAQQIKELQEEFELAQEQ